MTVKTGPPCFAVESCHLTYTNSPQKFLLSDVNNGKMYADECWRIMHVCMRYDITLVGMVVMRPLDH